MRLARAWCVGLVGLQATMVEVEVSFGAGLPKTVLVGMADTSVQEARERCRAAVSSAGFAWPPSAVTINLSPATLPKRGAHYDLPIVAALLAASGVVAPEGLEETVVLGELGLDGRVRAVRGVLPSLLAARAEGFRRAVVPAAQAREARLVEGLAVVGVRHLHDVVALLRGEPVHEAPLPPPPRPEVGRPKDLADVVGLVEAKWALEVAAAGGHHLSLTGPPGVGKTLLAERLPVLLPDLTPGESQEVSAIQSLVGFSLEGGLITRPPYADPHHTASVAALVGGGSRIAVPGAVSRAHRGVLFLDEAPEFSPRALEALRQPLESGEIVHARVNAHTTYPARFQLVTAANPCPCGFSETKGANCQCAPMAIRRYRQRLSGPILDRIDIQHRLAPMTQSYLRQVASRPAESSAVVAERVRLARERQRSRLGSHGLATNAAVPGPVLRRELPTPEGIDAIERAVRQGQLSARGVDKVLRLAWTIADLAGRDVPTKTDVHSALGLRRGENCEVSGA